MRNSRRDDQTTEKTKQFVEGVDYYYDDGLMVLCRAYLLARGYCCGNGCRHCPYDGRAGSKKVNGQLV